MTTIRLILLIILFLFASGFTETLEGVSDNFSFATEDGFIQLELSPQLDLEAYYFDDSPPGLVFADGEFELHPRFTTFIDAQIGESLYLFSQIRADQGFDKFSESSQIRFDEYFIRYSFGKSDLQLGKFATIFGGYVNRHDTWSNPFINAPLAYENVTTITDQVTPGSSDAFLGRRNEADKKDKWLSVVWGPSYASGVMLSSAFDKLFVAIEGKNASLSSRPQTWDAFDSGGADWFDETTVTSRVSYNPSAMWEFGLSGSIGPYLQDAAKASLPSGESVSDFEQKTFGTDISYAFGHLQIWSEYIYTEFEVPNVGDLSIHSYFIESRYKLSPSFFAAFRVNQQYFEDLQSPSARSLSWDRDITGLDWAFTYRVGRNLQTKLQYSLLSEVGDSGLSDNILLFQLTAKI